MNGRQAERYRGHFTEISSVLGRGRRSVTLSRTMRCAHCAFSVSRGRSHNARATLATMRGEMWAHLRERHAL